MNCIWIYLIYVTFTTGYNLENRLPLCKTGEEGSMFGFSVVMHKTSDLLRDFADKSTLVIGSPRAKALPTQLNTIDPGGVYYCPITTDPTECTRVNMDNGQSSEGNNKTNQWLGVTVASQNGGGQYLVTCAHRYSQRPPSATGNGERERVCGKCFLLDGTNVKNIREVPAAKANQLNFISSPCENFGDYDKNGFAYTQAGVSLAIKNKEYLLGGPGAYAWSGAMFGYHMPDFVASGPELPDFDSDRGFATPGCESGEFGSESSKVKCDAIPVRRDSYLGFSVAVSNSLKYNSNETIYIVGAPTGDFYGAVVLYTKETSSRLRVKETIMGEEIGSSFGFSVAAVDLNADGLDDLIVGAPQFYENEGKYGGRVYIYINSRIPKFSKIEPQKLNGSLGSFFGHSLAPLGDIDQDGYDDLAVGVPYDENGKVYIYRGSHDGKVILSQKLDGKKCVGIPSSMRGFGISLSGNVDIDNNRYPDLLVGTLNDQAILFRSRPIISVYTSFNVSKQVIDVTQPDCSLGGSNYSCFDLHYCFNYTSRHSEYAASLNVEYKIVLDTKDGKENKKARVRFSSPRGSSVKTETTRIARSDYQRCLDKQTVYFRPSTVDRLAPIKIQFEISLKNDEADLPAPNQGPLFNLLRDPILDKNLPSKIQKQVNILNSCGDDGCQSNLRINGSVPPEIVVGGNSEIILTLNVSNNGEEAHQASVFVKLPGRVFYKGFNVLTSSGADIRCSPQNRGNSSFVQCQLGNPYMSGRSDVINIALDVSKISISTKEVVFNVTGSTTSANPKIRRIELRSKVVIEMLLSLTGYGKPQQVRYANAPIKGESAIQYRDEIGPLIDHTFNVNNIGRQIAYGIQLKISFPLEINNGKWLLYLVSTRVNVGGGIIGGSCTDNHTNVLQYKLPSPAVRASRRSKRAAAEEGKTAPLYSPVRVATPYTTGSVQSTLNLNCAEGTALCKTLTCDIDPLQGGASVSVVLQSRLWNATFLEEFKAVDLVHVGVFGKLENEHDNVRVIGNQTTQLIDTTVDHAFFEEDAIPVFPWWYILIAFIVVLIVYIIIICLLKKCGFFKRKRYPARESPPDNVTEKDRLIEEEARNNEGRL